MLPEFQVDERHADPNETGHRESEFRKGWKAALDPEPYKPETLSRLTWHNLGYRLGRLYGSTSDEMIGLQYDWAVRQQQAANR
jgi:hypothetical protein